MTKDGNYVPKHQMKDIREDVKDAKKETGASRILIDGDIKNEFSTARYSETKEIKEFFRFIEKEFEQVILIKGNHDGFVEGALSEFSAEPEEYHLEEGTLFTHGHISLEELEVKEKYSTVVIGHEHPAIALEDEIGTREKVDCFLHGKKGKLKIVVMPAFSPISNGTAVNETPQKELLSPVLRNNFELGELKAAAVSREAGIFEFPKLKQF